MARKILVMVDGLALEVIGEAGRDVPLPALQAERLEQSLERVRKLLVLGDLRCRGRCLIIRREVELQPLEDDRQSCRASGYRALGFGDRIMPAKVGDVHCKDIAKAAHV